MTKTKSTKRALLMSGLALLMCVSMLIGSTFAWFTDSVTSSGNIIKSGTLDVTMEWLDGKVAPTDNAAWIDASEGAIFDYDLWEPGYTEVRHIKIANEGTLALKYQLHIVANGEVSELADVIDVYYIDPAQQITDRTALTTDKKIGTLTEVLGDLNGKATATMGNLAAGGKATITLALKMQESAGNKYQGLSIGSDFSIVLFATQYTSESDSFNNRYDAGAELPVVAKATSQVELAAAISGGADTVYLAEGTYKLPGTTNNEITLVGNGKTVIDLSFATGQDLSGTDVTLENLTVTGANEDYTGLQHVGNVVYNNVVFNNSTNLYGESVTFNDCTFNLTSRYIWTYGAGVATFNNCTFYTEGKAILAYKESDPATYTVNINDCTFYATQAGYTSSGDHCAAVEIDSSLVGEYVINFNGTNTVSKNFSDLYRIKKHNNNNVTINQNGTVVKTDLVPVSDGLFTDPNGNFHVSNAAGLQSLKTWMDSKSNKDFWGKEYNIMADIDASTVTWNTKHLSPDSSYAKGIVFNGNGHTISNLTINGRGLFTGATKGGNSTKVSTFKNITFDNVTVTGGSHHNGVVWGEAYGSLTLEKVSVINSKVSGGCNVGGLIGRNSESHATFTFTDCSVKNTTVEATKKADNAGASAFLGMALYIESKCSANVIFEGNNVSEGNTLTTAEGMQGGGIYTTAEWGSTTWDTPTVVNAFTNYNSAAN